MKRNTHRRLLHKILVLDCQLKKPLVHKNEKIFAEDFAKKIMKMLKMKPLGSFCFFEASDPNEPGWSFIQPITTSHISAHYFSNMNPLPEIRMDLYSCKKFEEKKVISFIKKKLPITKMRASIVMRDFGSKRILKNLDI